MGASGRTSGGSALGRGVPGVTSVSPSALCCPGERGGDVVTARGGSLCWSGFQHPCVPTVSPQCPPAVPVPSPLLPVVVTVQENPDPNWKASDQSASLAKKRAFCKFIAAWLQASAPLQPTPGPATNPVAPPPTPTLGFLGARCPPPRQSWSQSWSRSRSLALSSCVSATAGWALTTNDEKIFPLVLRNPSFHQLLHNDQRNSRDRKLTLLPH